MPTSAVDHTHMHQGDDRRAHPDEPIDAPRSTRVGEEKRDGRRADPRHVGHPSGMCNSEARRQCARTLGFAQMRASENQNLITIASGADTSRGRVGPKGTRESAARSTLAGNR